MESSRCIIESEPTSESNEFAAVLDLVTSDLPNVESTVDVPVSVALSLTPATLDIPMKTFLKPEYFVLPDGSVFTDRKIPEAFDPKPPKFCANPVFSPDYFVELHHTVASYNQYNFAGARIKLKHNKIDVSQFRKLLPSSYDDFAILQYLEFGFPLGLYDEFILKPVLKNHSSSYDYFTHIDKFFQNELLDCGMTGPFDNSPFFPVMVSPLMTSVKKPNSRRAVFDASFSDYSLNLNTPEKYYLGEEYGLTFPKLDDFVNIILKLGKGCYMWKRDLSRFFLQLPLDPLDYDKVACVWRGKLLFFTSYVWGCRHAGLNGQRVTTAVSTIHRTMGTMTECVHKSDGCDSTCGHLTTESVVCPQTTISEFNTLNYSDDFAGAEIDLSRAKLSFNMMGSLLSVLGLTESEKKAESPQKVMKYLGIEFDSMKLEMRVDKDRCAELLLELEVWQRKTVATKSDIQSILGKLLWVAKAVKFSRCFVLRIIAELKTLKSQKQKCTLSENIRKDFLWWYQFLAVFNGTELMVPNCIAVSVAGDACPSGMGSWNPTKQEYFSRKFPHYLLDPKVPIHIKEFICVIISVRLWGEEWAGKQCQIFCDNDSVCDVITYLKPKDAEMQRYLREFLYWVCRYNFHPVVSKIGTKENDVADFISRNFSVEDASAFFARERLPCLTNIEISDDWFTIQANW